MAMIVVIQEEDEGEQEVEEEEGEERKSWQLYSNGPGAHMLQSRDSQILFLNISCSLFLCAYKII